MLTSIRRGANADAELAAFEQYLVNVAHTSPPEEVAATGRRWRDALDDHLNRDGASKKPKKDTEHEQRRASFSRTLNGIGSSTAPSTPKAPRSSKPR